MIRWIRDVMCAVATGVIACVALYSALLVASCMR